MRLTFGHDFVLTFAPDAAGYAARLSRALAGKDFVVAPGPDDFERAAKKKNTVTPLARRGRYQVVVASRGASEDEGTATAIRDVVARGGNVVPIDIHNIRTSQPWFDAHDTLFIHDPVGDSGPSEETIKELTAGRSRFRANQLARIALALAFLILFAATLSAGREFLAALAQWSLASKARHTAEQNLTNARRALAESLWRRLDFNDFSAGAESMRLNTLWEISLTDPAVIAEFRRQLQARPPLVAALGRQAQRVQRAAAMTLDVAALTALMDGVMKELGNATGDDTTERFAAGLSALATDLDSGGVQTVVGHLVQKIAAGSTCRDVTLTRSVVRTLLTTLPNETRSAALKDSVRVFDGTRRCDTGFEGVSARIAAALTGSSEAAVEAVRELLALLAEAPDDKSVMWLNDELSATEPARSTCCDAIADALDNLAARVSGTDARALLLSVIDVTDFDGDGAEAIELIRVAKRSLAARLQPEEIVRLMSELLDSGEEPFGSRSEELAGVLRLQVASLPSARAGAVATHLIALLTTEHRNHMSAEMHREMTHALARAARALWSADPAVLQQQLIERIVSSDGDVRLAFVVSLSNQTLDRRAAVDIFNRVAAESASSAEVGDSALLGDALRGLARHIDHAEVTDVVRAVVRAKAERNDLEGISIWLASVPVPMTIAESEVIGETLIRTLSFEEGEGASLPPRGAGFVLAMAPDRPPLEGALELKMREFERATAVLQTCARAVLLPVATKVRAQLVDAMTATKILPAVSLHAVALAALPGRLTPEHSVAAVASLRQALAWSKDDADALAAATQIVAILRTDGGSQLSSSNADVLDYPTVSGPVAAYLANELLRGDSSRARHSSANGEPSCPAPRVEGFKCPTRR